MKYLPKLGEVLHIYMMAWHEVLTQISIKLSKFKMAASSSDGSEESLASLCREAEQLKVKIDEEKQKCNDVQRK